MQLHKCLMNRTIIESLGFKVSLLKGIRAITGNSHHLERLTPYLDEFECVCRQCRTEFHIFSMMEELSCISKA